MLQKIKTRCWSLLYFSDTKKYTMLVFKLNKKVGNCSSKLGTILRQKLAQLTPALDAKELGQCCFDAEKNHTLLRYGCPHEAEEI